MIRVLAHTTWGADSRTLLVLHRALILSKLEYGCEVYSSATPSRLKGLDTVHHSGLRLALGAFRTSPIPSLLVEAGELGLDLRRQSCVLRSFYRIQRLPQSATRAVVFNFPHAAFYDLHPACPRPFGYRARAILSDLDIQPGPVLPCSVSRVPPWVLPDISYCRYVVAPKAVSSDLVLRTQFLSHAASHAGHVPVFTDGSKSDAGAGFGVVFPDFSRRGSLPSAVSVFTAELSAILLALQLILTQGAVRFTIFSDSRAALSALEVFNSPHPLVQGVFRELSLVLRRGKRVLFCWVPAHVGIHGNECVDRVARLAAGSVASPAPLPDCLE